MTNYTEFPTNGATCEDCGAEAYTLWLNAYGPGKHKVSCLVCFTADNAPGVDHPIFTAVYGEEAYVTTILDSDQCSNCGLHVAAPDAIKHSKDFIEADTEWQEFLSTPESASQPQSAFYVKP